DDGGDLQQHHDEDVRQADGRTDGESDQHDDGDRQGGAAEQPGADHARQRDVAADRGIDGARDQRDQDRQRRKAGQGVAVQDGPDGVLGREEAGGPDPEDDDLEDPDVNEPDVAKGEILTNSLQV